MREGLVDFTSASEVRDGVKYTVQGSTDLSNWGETIYPFNFDYSSWSELSPGYEYQSFILQSSENLTTKGFMRVMIEPN